VTETWCAALNVLVLTLVAGLNGVLIRRTPPRSGSYDRDGAGSADE
jgi:hypothetical protein